MNSSNAPTLPGLDPAGQCLIDQRFPLVCQHFALSPPGETAEHAKSRTALVAAFRALPHDHLDLPRSGDVDTDRHQRALDAIGRDCWRRLAERLFEKGQSCARRRTISRIIAM